MENGAWKSRADSENQASWPQYCFNSSDICTNILNYVAKMFDVHAAKIYAEKAEINEGKVEQSFEHNSTGTDAASLNAQ